MKTVYILTNEAMPGIIKIGWTDKSVEERMKELDKTATPLPFTCYFAKRIDNARAYSGTVKKEEGLFESIITNLGKDKKPQKAKLAREISQTIKPSNIDEYIKIRTEVAETSPSIVRIVQQEDPDMKQGIGALYKST